MGVIKKYKSEAGGLWVRADLVQVGDTVTIQKVGLDPTTFDRPYVVVDGTFDRTGEAAKVRLGVKNVNRVSEVLGDEDEGWIGQKLKVISIESYPGLGRKGILWTGVQARMPGVRGGLPPNVSQNTKTWLRYNEALIGKNVPDVIFNIIPAPVKSELAALGWLCTVEDYPHLKEDARAALG